MTTYGERGDGGVEARICECESPAYSLTITRSLAALQFAVIFKVNNTSNNMLPSFLKTSCVGGNIHRIIGVLTILDGS